jgi:hypothetical protein
MGHNVARRVEKVIVHQPSNRLPHQKPRKQCPSEEVQITRLQIEITTQKEEIKPLELWTTDLGNIYLVSNTTGNIIFVPEIGFGEHMSLSLNLRTPFYDSQASDLNVDQTFYGFASFSIIQANWSRRLLPRGSQRERGHLGSKCVYELSSSIHHGTVTGNLESRDGIIPKEYGSFKVVGYMNDVTFPEGHKKIRTKFFFVVKQHRPVLHSPTAEKAYTDVGPVSGEFEGHLLMIRKSRYLLKSIDIYVDTTFNLYEEYIPWDRGKWCSCFERLPRERWRIEMLRLSSIKEIYFRLDATSLHTSNRRPTRLAYKVCGATPQQLSTTSVLCCPPLRT